MSCSLLLLLKLRNNASFIWDKQYVNSKLDILFFLLTTVNSLGVHSEKDMPSIKKNGECDFLITFSLLIKNSQKSSAYNIDYYYTKFSRRN